MTVSRSVRVPNARFTGSGSVTRRTTASAIDRGDGVDEREVPRLPAVAVDRQRPAGEGGVDERRHDGGVGVPGRLARPEDVEEAQRQRGQPEAVGVGVGVGLGRQLARRVRRHRPSRQVLALRAASASRRTRCSTTRRRRGRRCGGRPPAPRRVPVALARWVATGSAMLRGTDGRARRGGRSPWRRWRPRRARRRRGSSRRAARIAPGRSHGGCRRTRSTGRRARRRRRRRASRPGGGRRSSR